MPNIQVNEKDLSWYYRQRDPGAFTAYVIGFANFGPTDRPVLCNNLNFANVFGTGPVFTEDISYKIAASLIDGGIDVLFQRISIAGQEKSKFEGEGFKIEAKYPGLFGDKIKVEITEAGEGLLVKTFNKETGSLLESFIIDKDHKERKDWSLFNHDSEYIKLEDEIVAGTYELKDGSSFATGTTYDVAKSGVAGELEAVSDIIEDKYLYDVDVILAGGLDFVGSGSEVQRQGNVCLALANIAIARQDCVYILDSIPGEKDEFYDYAGNFNTSYVTTAAPYGYAEYICDGTTGLLPGSYAMVLAWGLSVSNGNPFWLAPAGVKRSTLGSWYRYPEFEVSKSTLDAWQNDSGLEYKVNPIMRLRSYGYCVYGNSTLLHRKYPGAASSLLQQLSVRVICNMIKKEAFRIALSLQFDQLTDDLFVQFKTLMGRYMDNLTYSQALYDYRIVLQSGNSLTQRNLNEATVPVRIMISPNPAAENFIIDLEVSQAGVTFTDETDENVIS